MTLEYDGEGADDVLEARVACDEPESLAELRQRSHWLRLELEACDNVHEYEEPQISWHDTP
jgi:hypothetical protein